MNSPQPRTKVGEIRPSQLMFSFGVGANIDLPHLSVMVMGLDDWNLNDMQGKEVGEERLLLAVREVLGTDVSRLLGPPSAPDTGGGWSSPFDENSRIGVPVALFPRWLRCPKCEVLAPLTSGLFEFKPDRYRPDRARYVHANCNKASKPSALPTRFLVACENGHLDDFPWIEYAHGGQPCNRPLLRLTESGPSGEAASIWVRCDTCKRSQSMVHAFGAEAELPKPCEGRHPHLRSSGGDCEQPLKAILLGASNSWFPITLSAFSIPIAVDKLPQLVNDHWPVLQNATAPAIIGAFRAIGQLNAFADYSDEAIWAAAEAKRGADVTPTNNKATDLKAPEWEVLAHPDPSRNSDDFRLRSVSPPLGYEAQFAQVTLVERLREVHALLGFTRIGSPGDYGEVEEIPRERWVPLARGVQQWVPATEVRGEGIFLRFNETAIAHWCQHREIRRYDKELQRAHQLWRQSRRLPVPNIVDSLQFARLALLHSFSHALMRQFCLECGYNSASIRERVYARETLDEGGPMAGILIYTAAPDSEGTLGGLVSLGESRTLARHIEQALEHMKICASDPLCAEHHPHQEGVTLHGAACHACLFAPETSCERGNQFLDRSLLVPTFGSSLPPFFG